MSKALTAKIGQLPWRTIFSGALGGSPMRAARDDQPGTPPARHAPVPTPGARPVVGVLHAPAVSAATLALMRQLDELHLQHPFAGSRMLRDLLRLRGVRVGRKHVPP